jgi:hypothetical protein
MESVGSVGRGGMKPAWYGGNKIPNSYLAKFSPKAKQDETLPVELRLFLEGLNDGDIPNQHA